MILVQLVGSLGKAVSQVHSVRPQANQYRLILPLGRIGVGMVAALGLTRAMTSMLVGVKATDPLTFVAMAGAFLAVTAIASWIPAARAAGLDPTNALREE